MLKIGDDSFDKTDLMAKLLLLIITLFFSVQSFAQLKEKLKGEWTVRSADSKEKKTIEFKFDSKGDHIIISTRKKGSSSSAKNKVIISEASSTITYFEFDSNFNFSGISHQCTFISDDVLELKNKDTNEILTLDRKK